MNVHERATTMSLDHHYAIEGPIDGSSGPRTAPNQQPPAGLEKAIPDKSNDMHLAGIPYQMNEGYSIVDQTGPTQLGISDTSLKTTATASVGPPGVSSRPAPAQAAEVSRKRTISQVDSPSASGDTRTPDRLKLTSSQLSSPLGEDGQKRSRTISLKIKLPLSALSPKFPTTSQTVTAATSAPIPSSPSFAPPVPFASNIGTSVQMEVSSSQGVAPPPTLTWPSEEVACWTFATSNFLPNEQLIAVFKTNPFPSRETLEALHQDHQNLTYRQLADWFERHRRKNKLKNPANAGRGRPRGRPRGKARGSGLVGTRPSREGSTSLSSVTSQSPPAMGAETERRRKRRGRPPGTYTSMSKKRRKGRGWVHDDDENDYGSTTSEGEAEQDEPPTTASFATEEMEPYSAMPLEPDGDSDDSSDLTDLQSTDVDPEGSYAAHQAAQAGSSRATSMPLRPQHPITTYTVRQIAGSRPLTYFNRPPPPETEAAYLSANAGVASGGAL